jgi:hypothetical protein
MRRVVSTALCRALGLGALALLALGCGAREATAVAVPSTPRPEQVVLELSMEDPESALLPIRDAVGEANAALVPGSARAIADALVPLPPSLRDAIEEGPLRAVAFERGEDLTFVVAVRTRGALEHLDEEGPLPGTRWVEGESAATYERFLVVASERRDVERAMGYLVTEASARTSPGLRVELVGPAVPTLLRAFGEDWVRERAAEAHDAIETERARHGEAPAFGDPEALATLVSGLAMDALAFLPDVAGATLTLDRTAAGPELLVSLALSAGSPAARSASSIEGGELTELLAALPPHTAIAAASVAGAEARRSRSEAFSERFATLGGERLGPDERAELLTILTGWDAMRGDRAVMAVSEAEGRPAYFFASDAASRGDEATLAAPIALPWSTELPYARALTELMVGCSALPPRAPSLGLSDGSAMVPLCADPENAAYTVARSDHWMTAAIARATNGSPAGDLLDVLGGEGSGLGADPDVMRLLSSHAGPKLGAVLIFPDRLAATLRALGRPTPMPDSNAALLASIAREGDTVALRWSATPSALPALATWIAGD